MIRRLVSRAAKGFTLIELMIVVAIIGVLAAIAVPNFVKFQCKSKQSEAKTNLKALYVAEEAYRSESNTYANVTEIGPGHSFTKPSDISPIGWMPKGNKAKMNYKFKVAGASATAFTGNATGAGGDMAGDKWSINQINDLKNDVNKCADR